MKRRVKKRTETSVELVTGTHKNPHYSKVFTDETPVTGCTSHYGSIHFCSRLHSRWFACARHGPVSMSQPRRSARLALQRESAESRPVEPVLIPLDDDTDSLLSVAATCAVCGECSSGNMVHMPCCDCAAHQGSVHNGVDSICLFCRSDVSDAVGIVAVQCQPAMHASSQASASVFLAKLFLTSLCGALLSPTMFSRSSSSSTSSDHQDLHVHTLGICRVPSCNERVHPECSTSRCTLHCASPHCQFHSAPNGVGAATR